MTTTKDSRYIWKRPAVLGAGGPTCVIGDDNVKPFWKAGACTGSTRCEMEFNTARQEIDVVLTNTANREGGKRDVRKEAWLTLDKHQALVLCEWLHAVLKV